MASQLQKLAVIEIDGQTYDLAANGHGALVTYDGPEDAYTGQAQARLVDLETWLREGDPHRMHSQAPLAVRRVQTLIDLLAQAYRQLKSSRDSKLGVGREQPGGGA